MDLQIDVGTQSDGYVFRLNPKTLKQISFQKGYYIPNSMFISFDTMHDFNEIYGKSMLIKQVPIGLVGLPEKEIKKQGFTDIVFYDTLNQKELRRDKI
jgi:hypothetical protein